MNTGFSSSLLRRKVSHRAPCPTPTITPSSSATTCNSSSHLHSRESRYHRTLPRSLPPPSRAPSLSPYLSVFPSLPPRSTALSSSSSSSSSPSSSSSSSSSFFSSTLNSSAPSTFPLGSLPCGHHRPAPSYSSPIPRFRTYSTSGSTCNASCSSSSSPSPSSSPSTTSPSSSEDFFHRLNLVLTTADPFLKCEMVRNLYEEYLAGTLVIHVSPTLPTPPATPSRPPQPQLLHARDLPSPKELRARGFQNVAVLLHNLAHIEITAVELCIDTILRFAPRVSAGIDDGAGGVLANLEESSGGDGTFSVSEMDEGVFHRFCSEFLRIAADEARHFGLLCETMAAYSVVYGDVPSHDHLWSIAISTKDDVLGRVAAVQLVQEPRALDSGDRLVQKFQSYGDKKGAELLKLICFEEIAHVAIGVEWFTKICTERNLPREETFHRLVKQYVGIIPPPFNTVARAQAGMGEDWYLPVSLRKPTGKEKKK